MRKIIEDYVRKRKKIEEMNRAGNRLDEKSVDEMFELEEYIRKSGYDPEQMFAKYLQKDSSYDKEEKQFPRVISQEIHLVKPVIPRNEGFLKSAEKIIETEHGLTRVVAETWYVVACGRKVDEKDIAGQCQLCGGFECKDHLVHCSEELCGKSLCIRCRTFLEVKPGVEVPFCPEHSNKKIIDFDAWEYLKTAQNTLLGFKEKLVR